MLDSHLWCCDRQQLDRSSRSAGNLNNRAFHNLPPPPTLPILAKYEPRNPLDTAFYYVESTDQLRGIKAGDTLSLAHLAIYALYAGPHFRSQCAVSGIATRRCPLGLLSMPLKGFVVHASLVGCHFAVCRGCMSSEVLRCCTGWGRQIPQ